MHSKKCFVPQHDIGNPGDYPNHNIAASFVLRHINVQFQPFLTHSAQIIKYLIWVSSFQFFNGIKAHFIQHRHPFRWYAMFTKSSSVAIFDFFSGRICGKNNTSCMVLWLVISITKRSIPIPKPDVGGMPYSSARRKSSSIAIASSSPRPANNNWSSKRSRWSIGSFNSEYALAISLPFTNSSKRSTKPSLYGAFWQAASFR